jgi:hypothetical protein
VQVRIAPGLLEDGPVGDASGMLERLQGPFAGVFGGGGNGHGRCHLATLVSAHTVSHAVEVGLLGHERGVLVVGTDLAHVSGAAGSEDGHTSSRTVLPT